jgi:hypothetical protein
MSEHEGKCGCCGVSLACCDVALRELLAGHRVAAVDSQNAARDAGTIRLEASHVELRAAERAAANATAAAAAACKTDALIVHTSNQTQKDVEACCCRTQELIRCEAERTRSLIGQTIQEALREKLEFREQQIAAYFAAKVPPVIP